MQASSAYDFEQFAQKIKKKTAMTVKEIEAETADYLLQKEQETEKSIASWLKEAENVSEQERDRQNKLDRHSIEAQMNTEWSAFIKERRSVLRSMLENRIEAQFSSLAECFISTIIKKYEKGTFTMPLKYHASVLKEGFVLKDLDKEKIIFTRKNLFIEYSVERILQELEDELTSHFQMEDGTWQG